MSDYDHPEDYCDECGRPNFSWVVASDRWGLATSKPGGDYNPILCPVCFVRRWEQATGLTASWTLVPDDAMWPLEGSRPVAPDPLREAAAGVLCTAEYRHPPQAMTEVGTEALDLLAEAVEAAASRDARGEP